MGTRFRFGILSAAAVLFTVSPLAGVTEGLASGESGVHILVLSSPADRVSGGEALVEIESIGTAVGRPSGPVDLNGQDITLVFHPGRTPGSMVGLVTGLRVGANTLTAHGPGHSAQTLTITNYPITGPITSGRHIKPFICQTANFRLPDGSMYGASLDADCSGPTRVTYLYMPVGGSAFLPLPSTTTLPATVATTTTTTGSVVKFVVRVETATIDRGIYQSAVLHDPTSDPAPSPFTPPMGWNHRLIAVEGFGCPGGWYVQGSAIGSLATGGMDFSLLSPTRLGEGYGLFSNTLMHPSNNCNSVLSGEAAMMSKAHFIETYGVPHYTVSAGCSGGSYGSIQLADALPGLFDGVLIACTFPDPLSIALSGSDGRLLTHYFNVINPSEFTTAQQVAISGYKGMTAFVDAARQSGRTDPVPGRADSIPGYVSAPFNSAVPVSMRYDPITNPHGARGTVYDAARNVYGVDPITGFALRPFDNVGVQYGLDALEAGTITPQQFLDLNQSIGGYDHDANYVSSRTTGDVSAIRHAFQGGLEFSGSGGAASIPVFDITGIYNDDSGYHYQWTHFATRERIAEANGNADNEVMWRGSVPFKQAWSTFITWVERVAADSSHKRQRVKVIEDKPGAAVDGCWRTADEFIAEPQTFSSAANSTCNTLFPSFAFPRFVAGGPLAADVLKCQLKPIQPSEYPAFTEADLARLGTIFPSGVCDWSKAGVGRAKVVPWASFGPAPENLVFAITKSP
jgi:uncharacterized tannase-like protein DUF6351